MHGLQPAPPAVYLVRLRLWNDACQLEEIRFGALLLLIW